MTTYTDLKGAIRKLPFRQREAFDRICIGQTVGHNIKTLEALERKQLVQKTSQLFATRFGPAKVFVFEATVPAHMAWCEVCSEEVLDEE